MPLALPSQALSNCELLDPPDAELQRYERPHLKAGRSTDRTEKDVQIQ